MNFTRRLLSINHKYPISPSTQRVSSPILVYFSYCLALCSFRRITAPVPPASSTGQDVVTFVANIELFMYIHWKRGGSKINIDVLEETPPVAFGILRMDSPSCRCLVSNILFRTLSFRFTYGCTLRPHVIMIGFVLFRCGRTVGM